MKRLGDRPYRVGDTVRVVSTDARWTGQVGTVTRADYDRRVPFVVLLPNAPDAPKNIGICFTAKSLVLVEAVDPELERLEECRTALCQALNTYVSPEQAAAFLDSKWLKEFSKKA